MFSIWTCDKTKTEMQTILISAVSAIRLVLNLFFNLLVLQYSMFRQKAIKKTSSDRLISQFLFQWLLFSTALDTLVKAPANQWVTVSIHATSGDTVAFVSVSMINLNTPSVTMVTSKHVEKKMSSRIDEWFFPNFFPPIFLYFCYHVAKRI